MWGLSSESVGKLFLICTLFGVAAGFPSSLEAAGTLSIQIQSTMEVTGDRLRAEIRYTNNGTASARSVQAHLTLPGGSLSGPVTERLGPGQSDVAEFDLLLEGAAGSRYPFVVYVDFKDGNNYPFSALSCGTVPFRGEGPGDIQCNGSEAVLSDHGTVGFIATNTGDATVEISARLVLPREFASSGTIQVMSLDPGEASPFHFKVSNSGALPGASYPVFCVVEYRLDGRHGSAVGIATVTVEAADNLFRRFRPAVTGVFVLTGFVLVWISARGIYKHPASGKRERGQERKSDADYL